MTTTNHWGILVDSETPIPGVAPVTQADYIADEIAEGIDLALEEYIRDGGEEPEPNSGLTLIGSWLEDEDGLYSPDPEGDYAAIVSESYIQVMFSRHTERVQLCSPCFPGQGDLGTRGPYLAYTLPQEIWYRDDE